jgi:endonuclease III
VVKIEDDINELPHNLGKAQDNAGEGARSRETDRSVEIKAGNKSSRNKASPKIDDGPPFSSIRPTRPTRKNRTIDARKELNNPAAINAAKELAAAADKTPEAVPAKKARRAKTNAYGLTPGETPYPDWPHPTAKECQEVTDLLSKVHGEVKAPATIPAPSTTVSGCGEVPSILDALIRTLLSAATTGVNSSRAFKGLVDTFGLLEEGVGKGSVNWNKVRLADRKDVFEAIKSGGLAVVKSQRIQEILNMVYEENIDRRNAIVKAEKSADSTAGPRGAQHESHTEKKAEIARADEHVLSLDHLHALSSDEALRSLIKYPGIGPKTASCVLLFCMQRPSFAVDTHVFRLCKWLNWVPPTKATRNSTYSHCEVRIPDHLKYPLHQLMIRHGKTCPRCRAATWESNQDWERGCPIDHLVTRTGKRKSKKAKKRKASKKSEDEQSDTELGETEEEGLPDGSGLETGSDDD